MKYIFTIAAFTLVFTSCEKKNRYRCECVGKRSVILLRYDEDRSSAEGGLSRCEMVQDSFATDAPNEQAQCFLYNIGKDSDFDK